MISPASETTPADVILIGDCTVTLSLREVVVPGARRPRRLTPKALGVLKALMRVPGAVVSRDELFAEVWPDTLPTNDVLTQAVTQLRKAFSGDDEGGTVYIETIAKTGYRLVQPVSDVLPVAADESDATTSDAAPASAWVPRPRSLWRRTRRYVYLAIGLAMFIAMMVMAALLSQRSAPTASGGVLEDGSRVVGSPPRPYRLITATAGFETYPTVSPDGSQVAYEAENANQDGSNIRLQTSGNAPARLLTETPAGHADRFPNWSPDGREIAFARFGPAGSCEVLLASATGGAIRHLTRCDGTELLSFDWTPNGRGMVFGSMAGRYAHRGIRVLDIASGQWTALQYPVAADSFDYAPRFSPDGRWIVFVRNPQIGDLWRMPATGGTPEQLTNDLAEIRGWAWRGDSRHIVFGRRVDSESRLYELDTQTRTLRDVGVDDAESPALARHTNMLAFVHRRPQFGLFRVPIANGKPGTPERLFPSSGRDAQPMLAPDGKQLVFTSDRSGSFGLWWADLTRPDSLRPVDGLRPETRQAPDWSPDSTRLLVSGRDAQARPVIYEVSPRDEQVVALPVPVAQPLQALYADDSDHVLVVERDRDEQLRLSLFDRRPTPWRLLGQIDGVSQARFDPAGQRVLFTRLSAGGLWSADSRLTPDSIRQVSEDRPTRWRYRAWAVARDGSLDYLSNRADCATGFARITGNGPGKEYCLDPDRLSTSNGFSAQPDGSALYLPLAVADGADIGVMTLPESPRPMFLSVSNLLFWKGK
ncbi:winged helix-turn-helix domain-containing protein [Stenotrophomonas oahuensis]|uniref:Winged helix-turn-helix domain-containing protein n=1 Tax=Stenotrophomonas oahuensis TaxID=3003271 RepID=A0ABY9YQY8_9GAMM|nr:winged helix-turn-helix domain-containing protein [Stenotrophomonas sp. A5586]WNH53344.1 winged helix-turn-helix domain-containing protein [Stenotrophomonas sp. A5586]